MHADVISFLLATGAYLVCSVPFGLVLARMFCGIDPRTAGSGNVGATNVARLCGTRWGVLTLLCDAAKGAVPVAAALWANLPLWGVSLVAVAALCGHMFSVFLRFRGGKGVATTVGVFLPLAFWQLVVAGLVCIGVIWRTGYVSAGSLTLVAALPVLCALSGEGRLLPLCLCVALLVSWAHRENIGRLRRGEEKSWMKKKG